MSTYNQHPSSFRDPSGFVFESDGKIFRQINKLYATNYDLAVKTGLYDSFWKRNWLIVHKEITENITGSAEWYRIIQPTQISFLSYPYEWCFEQLKDAALLTLDILKESLDHGMILKDATPYNIQFLAGRPILIDTLSFEKYDESKPWIAYRQFCETFLFPILIAQYTSLESSKIFLAYPEGVAANVTAGLLPFKAKFNLGNWLHVFMPASIKTDNKRREVSFNKTKLLQIIQHLRGMITSANRFRHRNSTWSNYYNETILSREYLEAKKDVVNELVTHTDATFAADLGSNDGEFAEQLSEKMEVVAVDGDEGCINALHNSVKKSGKNILPLCIDLMNPPAETGWNNNERKSFIQRCEADIVLALALIHHLCIGKNVSWERLVSFLSITKKWLVVEFVPKEDDKVQQLLSSRKDIFPNYDQQHFESAFNESFNIVSKKEVSGSRRTIYLMKKKRS
ncbi:MAG TPA: class I SAM-dependent methyltransferase [Chitinophagaceae bacterium]|nr:class I SAM-dependent methyltransferase [Chitinophagaceae bacterium]